MLVWCTLLQPSEDDIRNIDVEGYELSTSSAQIVSNVVVCIP